MNKKVIGAEECSYNGIRFRSKLEKRAAIELNRQGIKYEYEPETFTLVEGFKPKVPYIINSTMSLVKIRSISYTPDFSVKVNGYTVYIEMKGHANDVYPVRRKLFLRYLENKKRCMFVEAHSVTDLRNSILLIKEYANK